MTVPTDERPIAPPARGMRGEWRAVREPLRLLKHRQRLAGAPRGDGRLTVDLPGYGTSERSMAPIRWFLRRKGHDARPWGLGVNRGKPASLRHRFLEVLEPMVEATGRPANLVAWSLGGVVAREAARLRPDLVHRVVCFGSPLVGGPKYTALAWQVPPEECDRIEALQGRLDAEDPVQVPVTTIYSRQDRVVDWRASLDRWSAQVAHVEVRSVHTGLGVDPDVWVAVAEALAE